MHLIGYKEYRRGFFGCLADSDRYIYFLLSRQRYVEIKSYPKHDFEDFQHFVAALHKFVSRRFFLRRPLPVASPEGGGFAALGQDLKRLSMPVDFLGIGDPLIDPMGEVPS
jgi:hypothetical protein